MKQCCNQIHCKSKQRSNKHSHFCFHNFFFFLFSLCSCHSLSPRFWLDVGGTGCDVNLTLRAGSQTLLAQSINVQDLIDNNTDTQVFVGDGFQTALTPREICVQNDLLPCSTCIEWSPSTRPAPQDGKLHLVGCARLNVTCLGDVITDTDLGCFIDRTVAPRCFEPCTANSQCQNGDCKKEKCVCKEQWHGARCSYSNGRLETRFYV